MTSINPNFPRPLIGPDTPHTLWKDGKIDEALKRQRSDSHAETSINGSIVTTKYAVSQYSAKAASVDGDLQAY